MKTKYHTVAKFEDGTVKEIKKSTRAYEVGYCVHYEFTDGEDGKRKQYGFAADATKADRAARNFFSWAARTYVNGKPTRHPDAVLHRIEIVETVRTEV